MATAETPDEEHAALRHKPAPWAARSRKSAIIARSRLLLAGSGFWVRGVYSLQKHKVRTEIVGWLLLGAVAAKLLAKFQPTFARWFAAPRLSSLQTLLVSTGTALIGGAAIASSLVLFAMQVNVERLPFGLFRRLSSDAKLLLAFAGSFFLAISVASLSLIASPPRSSAVIGVAGLCIFLVLRSFLFAYKRSLFLISPECQLQLIRAGVAKEVRRWERHVRWAEPLVQKNDEDKFDQLRFTISQLDPRLRNSTDKALKHSVALAAKLSDQGDWIAAQSALQTVVAINELYVGARGRSFVASKLIGDNEHVDDPVITRSIELIKQYYRSTLARRDEEQMIASLDILRALASTYLTIEYRQDYESKTHACYAAGQLQIEVEQLVRHLMPDALYRAVNVLGACARELAVKSRPEDAVPVIQKIAGLGATGAAREDHVVITHAATAQLAKITALLFGIEKHDVHYVTLETLTSVIDMTKIVLTSPTARHGPFGGPLDLYYGGVPRQLFQLTNSLLEADAGDGYAQQVTRNVEEWADELHQPIKELLLLSVEQRSLLTITLVQFIHLVTEALLALASAECCRDHERDKLHKDALWLVSAFSWLPTERDPALHVQRTSFIETLLEIGLDARKWEAPEILEEMRKRILKWCIAVCDHEWRALEKGVYALAVIAVLEGNGEPQRLLGELNASLNETTVSQKTRDRAASEIRTTAEYLRNRRRGINLIENALASVDRTVIKELLRDAASILSPDTRDEPVRSQII